MSGLSFLYVVISDLLKLRYLWSQLKSQSSTLVLETGSLTKPKTRGFGLGQLTSELPATMRSESMFFTITASTDHPFQSLTLLGFNHLGNSLESENYKTGKTFLLSSAPKPWMPTPTMLRAPKTIVNIVALSLKGQQQPGNNGNPLVSCLSS